MFSFYRIESRDPHWNLLGGTLALLGGVAFLAWPQLALALVAGTLGLNLVLVGGHLLVTGWRQLQISRGPRVEQLYQEAPRVNPWVGASERERREARRARQARVGLGGEFFGGWF